MALSMIGQAAVRSPPSITVPGSFARLFGMPWTQWTTANNATLARAA